MNKLRFGVKLCVAALVLLAYELICDGSGIGIKERWEKMKVWAER